MNHNEQWLQWAIELQSLAQAGLTYGKDIYDKERYERIRAISAEIIANMADIPLEKTKEESGLDVIAESIIAIQDRAKHNLPAYAYGVCKVFVLCSAAVGSFMEKFPIG